MKKALVLLLVLFAVAPACAQETIEKEFEMSPGELMDVNLRPGGSIVIQGWEESRAVIRVEASNADAFQFDFAETSSGIEVRSETVRRINNVNVRVEIMLPVRSNLRLRTGGGGITIENVEGEINGRTGGGNLTLSKLKGSINLNTGGGQIELTDSQLDGRVTTGGGSVLLENVEGDIDATSGGGNVVYRNVTTPSRSYPAEAVYIRNAGGAILVEEAPGGADVRTGGGNISIRSAGQYVKATTGGGDIDIGQVNGWVDASTGGGDITVDDVMGWVEAGTGAGTIKVVMTGDPGDEKRDVTLSSGYGDIYLTVPENLSMEVEIELGFTRDSRQNFRIVDDFDIQQETTDNWDSSQGSPRKYIYGKATIGGGQNRIRIRTTNGNVYLRKGD